MNVNEYFERYNVLRAVLLHLSIKQEDWITTMPVKQTSW